MMITQILWVTSDKSPYLFLWVFLWIHERIHCLCDVLYGHESCYNPCVVLFGEVCAAAVLQQLQWAHRSTGSPVVTTHGLRLGTRYFCELWWLLAQVFGSSVLGALRDGLKPSTAACVTENLFSVLAVLGVGGVVTLFAHHGAFQKSRDAVESTGQWSSGREQ